MSRLSTLDAACVAGMLDDDPVTFTFGGVDYTGTAGPRDTFKQLTEGGFHADQDFSILVPVAAFGSATRPAEKDKITVWLGDDGIPTTREDSTSSIVARIKKVGRAGSGLTFSLSAEGRG